MDFDTCIDRVLGHEGGYVNDPRDPGGETKWGISKRQYPRVDIRNLTREQAKAIYRRDYWEPVHADDLPAAMRFQMLDVAVNHGVERAVRFLQEAAGATVDGKLGPITLAAARAMDPAALVLAFNGLRLAFYADLRTFDRFGRGWTNRVASNLGYAAADLA